MELSELPLDFNLYDSLAHGNAPMMNLKEKIGRSWRQTSRAIGGYWMAVCDWEGTREEMLWMFRESILREIRVEAGGVTSWRGFLAKMELTIDGETYQRTWEDLANAVKVVYSRIGPNTLSNGSAESAAWDPTYNAPDTLEQSTDWVSNGSYSCHIVQNISGNLLTNGGAESGAWTAYNTPTTLAQSTYWVSEGTYSCHIAADAIDDGATIQTGISITANTKYKCSAVINAISGTWRLEVYREDTGETLATGSVTAPDARTVNANIDDGNTYAGNIGVRITCRSSSGECYADAVVFRLGAESGAIIDSGLVVVENKPYEARVTTNLISGTWKLEIYRTDTGESLGSVSEATAGQRVMRATVSDSNTYSGPAGLRLYCTSVSGEIYGDGAVFQEGPVRAETAWQEDAASQTEYGRFEDSLLEAGMSDETANAKALTQVAQRAWIRTLPPQDLRPVMETGETKLSLTFYGHVFSARNTYTLLTGNGAASDLITSLAGETQYLSAGAIDANSLDYQIENRADMRVWEMISDIVAAGDSQGNRWQCGVYDGLALDYTAVGTSARYRLQNGRILNLTGGPMDPWLLRPALCRIDDMPLGPSALSGDDADDPRVVMLEEITFDVSDWLRNGYGLTARTGSRRNG